MADEESGNRSSHERADSLLRVVHNLLERTDDGREENPVPGTSSGEQHQWQSTDYTHGSRNVLHNFHNLFSSYASSENQSSSPPLGKRQKREFIIPRETWTHELVFA